MSSIHEHPFFIKYTNNYVNHPTGYTMWNGWGSVAHHSGPMFRYILLKAASSPEKTIVVSSCSDDIFPIPDEITEAAKAEDAVVIAPVLCSYGPTLRREYLYIPASDIFFAQSMYDIFAPSRVPWEERKPYAVWRGGLSGEMLRIRAVQFCLNVPHTDVKLVDNWPRPEYNPEKTPELFAERIEANEQCQYKAIFWIDGNCISSNVLWVFASGAVPIIINETCYWFKHMIKPWVHYVPVSPDFSDLEANVRWIFENDAEARKIAENALEFSRTQLSPEGQRAYLDAAIEEHIRKSKEPAPTYPPTVEAFFPLLSFGNIQNSQRVRRKASHIVEGLLLYEDVMKQNNHMKAKEHMDKVYQDIAMLADLKHPEIDTILRKGIEALSTKQ